MRAGSPGARRCSARLQRHDGLGRADPPGDAGELARVAQRLQVKRDHRGPVVTARRSTAGRSGSRRACSPLVLSPTGQGRRCGSCSQSRTPTAPDCETRASRPGSGSSEPNVAVIRTPGSVLATPRQFGPTSRIPCVRATSSSLVSTAAPKRPVSPKPAVITVTARTPMAAASSITPGTADAGTATTARSTGSGNRQQRRERRHAADRPRRGIDRVDRPGEVADEQGPDNLMPHVPRVASCPDDGDRARPQDRRDAGDLRRRLPLIT